MNTRISNPYISMLYVGGGEPCYWSMSVSSSVFNLFFVDIRLAIQSTTHVSDWLHLSVTRWPHLISSPYNYILYLYLYLHYCHSRLYYTVVPMLMSQTWQKQRRRKKSVTTKLKNIVTMTTTVMMTMTTIPGNDDNNDDNDSHHLHKNHHKLLRTRHKSIRLLLRDVWMRSRQRYGRWN